MWPVGDSVKLAQRYVGDMGDRWVHLSTVGRVAEALAKRSNLMTDAVVSAAWLHDVGYSQDVSVSGFHALDGAQFLRAAGYPDEIVALVAHHTGAGYEAEERGLLAEWEALPVPNRGALDTLTMIDLAVGPTGQLQLDDERVTEMLSRYREDHPVHRAVTRSREQLMASSLRGKQRLGLPNDWPLVTSQGVGDAESHRGMEI